MKNFFTWVLRICTWGFLFSIPFGTRKLLGEFASFSLPRFQEYTAGFLYGTDIALLVVLAVWAWGIQAGYCAVKIPSRTLLALVGIIFLSTLFAPVFPLAFLFFFHFLGAVLVGYCVAQQIRFGTLSVFSVAVSIALSAVFQAGIAIEQFIFQHSVGFLPLGESLVAQGSHGVARVVVGGARLLRSFGTMDHANILAAFLVLGIAALCYIFFHLSHSKSVWQRILVGMGLCILLVGLLFTFSRSGWIAAAITLAGIFLGTVRVSAFRKQSLLLMGECVLVAVLLLSFFGTLFFTRAHATLDEPSVDYRVRYTHIGLTTIWRQPWGTGVTGQVRFGLKNGLYAQQEITQSFDFQPVHNLYVLIGSEAGVEGLVVFLLLLFFVVREWIRSYRNAALEIKIGAIVFGSLLIAFLVVASADHYFWDLQAGRLMFWVVLGIMMGLSPRRSMDRTLASEAGN